MIKYIKYKGDITAADKAIEEARRKDADPDIRYIAIPETKWKKEGKKWIPKK